MGLGYMLLNTMGERLEFIQKKLGGSARAEELTGVGQSQQSRMIRGSIKNPSVISVGAMARAAGVSLDWVVFGTGEPDLGAIGEGIICLDDLDDQPSPFSFKTDYLLQVLNVNPRHVIVWRCDDDAMEPTIKRGSHVLIDKSATSGDGVFLVSCGSVGIRRIQKHLTQKVDVIPDNSQYAKQVVDLNLVSKDDFDIVGKVVMTLQP